MGRRGGFRDVTGVGSRSTMSLHIVIGARQAAGFMVQE